ncbi:hypothetical protein PT2222_50129 [Paraburkholderia tropica]
MPTRNGIFRARASTQWRGSKTGAAHVPRNHAPRILSETGLAGDLPVGVVDVVVMLRADRGLLADLIADDAAHRRAAHRRQRAAADHGARGATDTRADGGVAIASGHVVTSSETAEHGDQRGGRE